MARDEQGNIIFDEDEQKKVDEIVRERVARVKSEKPEDYDDLKEIASLLEDYDYTGTPAEKKEALRQAKEAREKAAQADNYKDAIHSYEDVQELPSDAVINALAKKWGKDPKSVEKALQNQIDASEKEEQKKISDAAWNKQVKEFEQEYSDVDLDELGKNEKFLKFVKGKAMPLKELYADFLDFIGEAEAEAVVKYKTKEAHSTGSGKGSGESKDTGLTTEQKKSLDEWNRRYPHLAMTAKEYKNSLS